MREVTLYSSGIGLNNKVAPHRLPFGDGGVAAFEAATDVLVDRTGEVVTRRGTVQQEAGAYHSLFPVGGGFYCIKDNSTTSALYLATIQSDGSVSMAGVRSGLAQGSKASYATLGDKVFYANGFENGILDGDISSAWTTSNWTGGTNTDEKVTTPVGSHIDVLSGRILLSVGDELFATEYGLPGLVDITDDRRRFEDRIIMILAVQSGAFVSTQSAIYFLAGTIPKEWQIKKVLDYPAVEWGVNSDLVDPSHFGLETNQLSALFATVNGPVIGLPDGTPINLIDKSVTLPSSCSILAGSIMVVDESMIVQSGV